MVGCLGQRWDVSSVDVCVLLWPEMLGFLVGSWVDWVCGGSTDTGGKVEGWMTKRTLCLLICVCPNHGRGLESLQRYGRGGVEH